MLAGEERRGGGGEGEEGEKGRRGRGGGGGEGEEGEKERETAEWLLKCVFGSDHAFILAVVRGYS